MALHVTATVTKPEKRSCGQLRQNNLGRDRVECNPPALDDVR